MFYSNEIRPALEYAGKDGLEIKDQERTLAEQLIKNLAAPFKPEKYHDTYQEGLRTLIDAKAKGMDVAVAPHVSATPVIDLMAALKSSIASKAAPAAERKNLLSVVPKGMSSRPATMKKSKRKAG